MESNAVIIKAVIHTIVSLSPSPARKSLIHELNEGVSSRLLKLEKENRELQASIEKLREEKTQLQGQQLSAQELERENQGLGKKVRMHTYTRQHTYTLPQAHTNTYACMHPCTHTSIETDVLNRANIISWLH